MKYMMSTRMAAALLFIGSTALSAQKLNPVQWSMTVDPATVNPAGVATARIVAKLDPGWHIYSLTTPEGGPTPTILKLEANPAISSAKFYQPKPSSKFDNNFKIDTEIYEKEVTFLAQLEVAGDANRGPVDVALTARYQACTEKECLPRKASLTAALNIDPKVRAATAAVPAGFEEFTGKRSAGTAALPSLRHACSR
jgi:thiol:disulfide interchange protein DsbD